jgi:hypothetical protein
MEDLWRIKDSGIDLDDLADAAEYKRFLNRFCSDEEQEHQRRLLLENADDDQDVAKT